MEFLRRPEISNWIYFVRQYIDIATRYKIKDCESGKDSERKSNGEIPVYFYHIDVRVIRDLEQNFIDGINALKFELPDNKLHHVQQIILKEFRGIESYKLWYKNNEAECKELYTNHYYIMLDCMQETINLINEFAPTIQETKSVKEVPPQKVEVNQLTNSDYGNLFYILSKLEQKPFISVKKVTQHYCDLFKRKYTKTYSNNFNEIDDNREKTKLKLLKSKVNNANILSKKLLAMFNKYAPDKR
jgi:hypothetical protein